MRAEDVYKRQIQNYHDTVGIELPIWVRPNALPAEETLEEETATALSRD